MKYLVVSFILFFCTLQTFSQQEYFVYLQTENNQAFYIRINNTVYSSTSSGYLILSKLPDSTAIVTIGFAKNVFPEQQFNIPVNHKDAGYLVKNFGDKGWGLFNLQTQAVIMNSNPLEEKKSPEITSSRKNDAFSLLLANAVNDTAVLYTVNRPKKPVPVIAVVEEKKKDTLSLVKEDSPKKDSMALVKNLPAKKDSLIAKNSTRPKKDSISPSRTQAKNKKLVHDTVSVVKNTVAPPINTGSPKNQVAKINQPVIARQASKPKKDSLIIVNPSLLPKANAIAKNNKKRKDTIIIMKGRIPDDSPVAKNKVIPKANKPAIDTKKDSLKLVKNEAAKKAAEKTTVPATVSVKHAPVTKDTLISNAGAKKDTAAGLVKNEVPIQAADKKDSVVTIPERRLRPLINKAAELLTDTSYVAVFVDESKDKFDTIRISIPFDEAVARAKQNKLPAKEINLTDSLTIKDSAPVITPQQPAPPVVKNDTTNIDKLVRDSTPVMITQQIMTPAVKKDTVAAVNKPAKDSTSVFMQQPPPPAIKKDSSAPAMADSGRVIKAPPQPLFLNSDCKEIAWDSDIDKLRIKMLLVVSDEDRITVAKKVYKQKCFSVKQVKALSELFKTDEGKYKWFDAVYPFVSDSGNFSSLGELIKNDYFLNRFKAMLRN